MLGEEEKMSIMIQEAVGTEYKGYFFPLLAGVGFSRNGFCWSKEIKKEDGIVRMVFGFGTRAVGRGYARLFSPGAPHLRPEGFDVNAIAKFSQGLVDVLDLREDRLKSIRVTELIGCGTDSYPFSETLISLKDGDRLYRPASNFWDKGHQIVLTFDEVLSGRWLGIDLPNLMKWLFGELEAVFYTPVDIEFAVRADPKGRYAEFYLVQARPLSQREELKPLPLPNVPDEKKIFFAGRLVPTAFIDNIGYIVYVVPAAYRAMPTGEKYSIARLVGKINHALEGKRFVLMGPGRWGSTNPELGVPVRYSEICNASALVEVSVREGDYLPEVSYGTHFFQDLVEDKIVYAPLYPDDANSMLNEDFIIGSANQLMNVLKDEYYDRYKDIVRVVDIFEATGSYASLVFNGEEDRGVLYIKDA